ALRDQGAFDRAYSLAERIAQARRSGFVQGGSSLADRLDLAWLAHAAGRRTETHRICEEVVAQARAKGDAEALAQAALLVGADIRPAVVDRKLVALLKESLAALGEQNRSLGCRVLARLSAALQPAHDPMTPVGMALDAITRARTIGDDALLREVLE